MKKKIAAILLSGAIFTGIAPKASEAKNKMPMLFEALAKELVIRTQPGAPVNREGLLHAVRELLAKGADPNECLTEAERPFRAGDCPLHVALMLKEPEVVRALVKAGADVRQPKPFEVVAGADATGAAAIATPHGMIAHRKNNARTMRERLLQAKVGKNQGGAIVNESRRAAMLNTLEEELRTLDALEEALGSAANK